MAFWKWFARGRHPQLAQLAKGTLVVSLALLQRSGGRLLPDDDEVLRGLLDEAAQLARTMVG